TQRRGRCQRRRCGNDTLRKASRLPSRSRINVNGRERSVSADCDTPLLYVLRDELGLRGPKFGCGLGQCGACSVMLGANATRSCIYPVADVGSQKIVTVEGLPQKFAQSFTAEQAA